MKFVLKVRTCLSPSPDAGVPTVSAQKARPTSVIRYRPFRNSDPPALVALWNRTIPSAGAARPLRVHELDLHAFGTVHFDRAGLIVAERDDRLVGFVHAGFGPDLPVESTVPFRLDSSLGTIAMLAIDDDADDPALPGTLVLQAERYLRSRGAQVLYGGGQFPLNPYYWGIYGGSEGSGVPSRHTDFHRHLVALGYQPAGLTVSLEYGLDRAEPRDPRGVLIRRQTELQFEEDAMPVNWWQNQALSQFRLTRFRLLARSDSAELARADIWDMSWFGRSDGRARVGICSLLVSADHRRQGYGEYLVSEILRWAREHGLSMVEVQTAEENRPALALYQSLGFLVTDHSTVYRLPAELLDRSKVV